MPKQYTYKPDATVGGQFLPAMYNGKDWAYAFSSFLYDVRTLKLKDNSYRKSKEAISGLMNSISNRCSTLHIS